MDQIVIYMLMVQKFINLKQKILRLQQLHYVQETFKKTWTVDNMKKTGLNGYDAIAVDGILDIYKYLMKKK